MAIRNFAEESFSSSSDGLLVPRQKFNFALVLERSTARPVIFNRVSSVSMPSFTPDTLMVNQYNKKRVIQTRLNYDPIQINFYDTFDSLFMYINRRYLSHYFNGGNGIEERRTLEGSSTVDPSFTTDLGFTPNSDRYFFPRIRIIQGGYRNLHRQITLINPTITAISGDTLDYSSSDPVMWNVTFQPESVQITENASAFDFDTTTSLDTQIGGFGDTVDSATPQSTTGLPDDFPFNSVLGAITGETAGGIINGATGTQVGDLVERTLNAGTINDFFT